MTGNTSTLSANGNGAWLRLARGLNVVYISCASWASTTAPIEYALDRNGTGLEPVFLDGAALVISSSTTKSFTIWGDGESCVRMKTANYGSSPITMTLRASIPVNPQGI
jgi:hypothetical protein